MVIDAIRFLEATRKRLESSVQVIAEQNQVNINKCQRHNNFGNSRPLAFTEFLGRNLKFYCLWNFSSVRARRINLKKFYLEPKSHDI